MLNKRDLERIERLEELMEYYDFTINKFAETIGIAHQTIGKKLARKQKIGYKVYGAIEDTFPEVNMDYLREGVGELILKSSDRKERSLFLHEMAVEIKTLKEEMALMNRRVSRLENFQPR